MNLPGMLALALCCSSLIHAAEAPAGKKRTFRVNLSLEDKRDGKIKAEFKTGALGREVPIVLHDLVPGTEVITLPDVRDGEYYVYFSSPGYASQWQRLELGISRNESDELKAHLFRKRYVVLRYAFNPSGGRELSTNQAKEGRAAVAHWGGLPYFRDWQIWQKPADEAKAAGALFGDTLFLEFHRFSAGFGFSEAPKGVAFEDLKEAPAGASYQCESVKAVKGLTLFCRVEGDRKENSGYGKIFVEEVTETPPAGIKIIAGQ